MAAAPSESVTTLMQRPRKVVGAAVIRDSSLAWSHVAGGEPDRLFQAGSISKPVTALVALELAARGRLDLDGDVNGQLTSWHLPGPHRVSLRQLLGHTAGTGVPFFPGYPQGAPVPALRQVLDGVPPSATAPVRAGPAARGSFRYSGGGYAIVQQLIADATGMPFEEAAAAAVLHPCGMTRSTFAQPLPASLRPAAARHDWRVYPEAAAAGLWTTPGDLARYVCAIQAALVKPRLGHLHGSGLLAPGTARAAARQGRVEHSAAPGNAPSRLLRPGHVPPRRRPLQPHRRGCLLLFGAHRVLRRRQRGGRHDGREPRPVPGQAAAGDQPRTRLDRIPPAHLETPARAPRAQGKPP